MYKIDFKKSLKPLYGPTKTKGIHLVDVPAMRFLMIDGHGDPNVSQDYKAAVEALYTISYALKAASKKQLEKDYVVPPLEGLWWSKSMGSFKAREKNLWEWTMMIMVPEWIGPAMIDAAITKARKKKTLSALEHLRVELLEEGRAAQVLHIGSYDDEGPVIAKMHEQFMPEHGLEPIGKHHEIYLSDPRKVAPERLKTILRQPVREMA